MVGTKKVFERDIAVRGLLSLLVKDGGEAAFTLELSREKEIEKLNNFDFVIINFDKRWIECLKK